ncbi:MAG: ExeA family protein [Phycisphaerae bacterium]
MYLSFYNLREFPFAITCDSRYFFESSAHAEALANMMYTVQQRKGMVLVTGEVGAGKTFVGNMLTDRLGAKCLTVYMKNPPQSAKQLIRAVAAATGMNVRATTDKMSMLDALEEQLVSLLIRRRLVALILDECQDLPASSLEELRLLWNWEYQGNRLVQIILIGQPELRERLMQPRWEPLRQRIVLSYHLRHLNADDTSRYISHRLAIAANEGGAGVSFSDEARDLIFQATDGIPRLVNVLCDNALLVGYARDSHLIGEDIVSDVLRDMTCWGLQSHHRAGDTDSLEWSGRR